jgi:hypothetical protein
MSSFPIAPTPKPTKYDLETDALRQEPGGFGVWLERNPEPSLVALVEAHGGYSKIPSSAWAEFDRQMEAWRQAYRLRNATPPAPPKP